ncbi:MAG: hypothetical protein ACOY0T_02745 [Myxococcota bacterium]
MATEADDRWYVQFDSKEVRLMTLDEIQEAFEAGLIHENTYLIEVGASNWQTLADVAGLNEEDDEEPAADAAPAPAAPAPQPVVAQPALQPVAAAAMPARVAPAPTPAAQPFPPAAAPASVAPQSAWPPVATARAPQSVVPSAPYSSGMNSTMPVVQDLDLDMSGASFKTGKRTALIAAFAAVVVLGGGGFALANMDSQPASAPVAAAPAPVATTSPFKMDPAPSAPSTPSTTSSSSSSSDSKADSSSGSSNKLSEDMKAALLASDKGKAASKKGSTRTASATRHAAAGGGKKSGGGVFKSGGSDHDPLNSKL